MLIQIYGRSMCESCENITNALEINNIPYEYYNIEYMMIEDVSALISRRIDPNNRILPIIFIEGRERTLDEFKQFIDIRAKHNS